MTTRTGRKEGKIMTADKMLAKLGYIKLADDIIPYNTIVYQKRVDNELTKTLTFYTKIMTYRLRPILKTEPEITLLQAINEKIKELGWEE